MEKKPFKILSIDGGGIKGLYSASVLARIEEQTGKCFSDHFDMICGTSTGGLIALALTIKIPASDIVKLYYEQGSKIFPTSNHKAIRVLQSKVQFLKQLLVRGKYSPNALRSALEETFGEKTLGEANNLLCIPSYNLIRGEPRVFKYPHKEGKYYMDRNIKMVDAALATSSAPSYFPVHEIDGGLYVDGGVWANNPSLCGLVEALNHFVGEERGYDRISILSVGSVEQPNGWVANSRKSRSFRTWGSKLFSISLESQAFFNDFFLSQVLTRINPNNVYYRIPSPRQSSEHLNLISMDRADRKAIDTLKFMGRDQGSRYSLQREVLEFFENEKTYKTS